MKEESDSVFSTPVVREYSRLAPDYDDRWSFYIGVTVDATLARLSLNPGERILDVGCGTGALLRALGERDGSLALTGVDPVREMLEVARQRLPDRIRLLEAWAEQLPFESGCFEKVISCSMFHFVREPARALAEFSRVLVPGGQLIITDWCDDYVSMKVHDLYLRLFDAAHYKTYKENELRNLLHFAGYGPVTTERYKINWLWGMMTATAVKK